MNQKFFETYVQQIEEKRIIYKNRLLSGHICSFDDYKDTVGKLLGLDMALEIMRELGSSFFNMKIGIENGKVFVVS